MSAKQRGHSMELDVRAHSPRLHRNCLAEGQLAWARAQQCQFWWQEQRSPNAIWCPGTAFWHKAAHGTLPLTTSVWAMLFSNYGGVFFFTEGGTSNRINYSYFSLLHCYFSFLSLCKFQVDRSFSLLQETFSFPPNVLSSHKMKCMWYSGNVRAGIWQQIKVIYGQGGRLLPSPAQGLVTTSCWRVCMTKIRQNIFSMKERQDSLQTVARGSFRRVNSAV